MPTVFLDGEFFWLSKDIHISTKKRQRPEYGTLCHLRVYFRDQHMVSQDNKV